MSAFKSFTLDSGLQVIVHKDPGTATVKKVQLRVQTFPKIINVAVPAPLVQMV